MTTPSKAARYRLLAHPGFTEDLTTLSSFGPEVITALQLTLDDLAHGRVTGKALGVRHVSGDLTGLASVKFDVDGSPTRRFRLIYGDIDGLTRGVLAVGIRDEHAIYRLAVQRIDAHSHSGPTDDEPPVITR